MPGYARFAPFYDAAMDDPTPRAARVTEWIGRHHPDAASVLELGCGTGSVLARLSGIESLTGLDRSPEMLAVARRKVPRARLFEGDMASFRLEEQFDVVVCVFDSLNHLLSLDAWRSMFRAVYEHLRPRGLFIFDVNTVGELRRLGDEPPWVYDFDQGVLIMDVTFAHDGGSQGTSLWDIRIFEHLGQDRYALHHEQIGELGVELSMIRSSLDPNFVLLEQVDEIGGSPTDESVKAHFAFRRR